VNTPRMVRETFQSGFLARFMLKAHTGVRDALLTSEKRVERLVCVSFDRFHLDCGLRLLCLLMGGMQISVVLSESGMMIVSCMPNSWQLPNLGIQKGC